MCVCVNTCMSVSRYVLCVCTVTLYDIMCSYVVHVCICAHTCEGTCVYTAIGCVTLRQLIAKGASNSASVALSSQNRTEIHRNDILSTMCVCVCVCTYMYTECCP